MNAADQAMMEPGQAHETLYDRLMRLKPDGLSTRAWTINAGVGSGFFDKLASGGKPRDGELPKILAVVGMTLGEFEGRRRPSSPVPPASLPVLRVMPREPKSAAQTGAVESPASASPEDRTTPSRDEATAQTGHGERYGMATAEAIERWLEARRQAIAAGLDTSGIEGARLVTDLARLAIDLERAPG
jgi:hypothetical protein